MDQEQTVVFHVGLGKVASTYLQHRFFPFLDGIQYLPTNRYKKSREVINRARGGEFLVSREFDRQLERELKWFTEKVPSPKVIVIFRRHASWVASQYRRYVKNGWHWDFQKFIDTAQDQGFWKLQELNYQRKIELIRQYTGRDPLILFHEDLKHHPDQFFEQIAQFCGATYDKRKISLDPVHRSYSEKQLLVIRGFCRRFKRKPPKAYHNKILHWLLFRSWWAFFHLILYLAVIFPTSWVPKGPLIDPQYLKEIDLLFQKDWEQLQALAKDINPKRGVN